MKKSSKSLSVLLASTAVLGGAVVSPFFEQKVKAEVDSQTKLSTASAKEAAEAVTTVSTKKAIAAQFAAKGVDFEKMNPAQVSDAYVDVVVQLSSQPASQNGSLVKDYSSTAEIENESDKVIASQVSVKQQVEAITNQGISDSYGYVVNGFSTKVKVKDIEKIRRIQGVKSVTLDNVFFPAEANADSMANVQTVWSNYKYKGEKTVVSVIDTGIDVTHKDMRLSDDTNVKLTPDDVNDFIDEVGHGKYFTAKVPYGYNYADGNSEFVYDDDPTEQHGMHVAGIIGANGTGDNPVTSAVGVAPEAQLLAMKVFTNSDSSATTGTSTVVAAIEDSAKIGADVLNMSLGSSAGFQSTEDPEVAAVQNATEAGTAAVISAGNAGTTNSLEDGTNVDHFGGDTSISDSATVGTPGTTRSAVTVASGENTKTTDMTVAINDGTANVLPTQQIQLSEEANTDVFNNTQFAIVKSANPDAEGHGDIDDTHDETCQLGYGYPEDFTDDVKGKIAIVRRGNLNFTEKQANAAAAGAVGLIIVDNASFGSGNPLVSITLDNSLSTFGLSRAAGNQLLQYVEQHPESKFTYDFGTKQVTNYNYVTDKMSTFTSYGPTPDLSFKPDITAPGGNIWSTQNNDSYMNMSGTSMAAPFVSGAQALLKQATNNVDNPYRVLYQGLSGTQLTDLLKTIQMNTSKPINDSTYDNGIVSPRRQGAGLLDVNAAIDALDKNPSTVVSDNGYPAVELRSFDTKQKSFTLTFTNRTSKDLTYHLVKNEDTDAVYTSATDNSNGSVLYDRAIEGASVDPAADEVVVPAGASTKATFTINLPESFDEYQYVEGFLNFEANDGSSLNMPYMGFYGNWNELPIFDDVVNAYTGYSQLKGSDKAPMGYSPDAQAFDPDAIAFSSSEDANRTSFSGEYYTFRNAMDVQTEIFDADGNLIATTSKERDMTKAYYYPQAAKWQFSELAGWDGQYYDQATGEYKTAPDGQYTYRVSGIPVGGTEADRQTVETKVKLDSVAPEVRNIDFSAEISDDGTQYYLTAEAKDDFSGLDITHYAGTVVNGEVENASFESVGQTEDGYTKIRVPLSEAQAKTLAAGDNNVELYFEDNATNSVDETAVVQKPGETVYGLVLDGGPLPETLSEATAEVQSSDDGSHSYVLSGTYPHQVYATYTDAAGQTQTLPVDYDEDSRSFAATLPLDAADYDLQVTFYSDPAHEHAISTAASAVKLAQPTVKVTVNNGNAGTSEKTVPVTGEVSADTEKVVISNGTDQVEAKVENGQFTAEVPVNFGANEITVTVTDADGNETTSAVQTVTSSQDAEPLTNAITFDDGITFGIQDIDADTKNFDPETGIITVTGHLKHNYQTFEIIGAETLERSANGLDFTATFNVGQTGMIPYTIHLNDASYDINDFQETIAFELDQVAPTLDLDNPTDAPVYTSNPSYTLTGSASDNLQYIELYVNGNQVVAPWNDVDVNGTESQTIQFDHDVELKEGKNVLTIEVGDAFGNVATKVVTVYYEPQEARDEAKAALQALEDQSEALETTDDTPETVAALNAAQQAAKEVLGNADATLADYAQAQKALQDAIDGLVKAEPAETTEPTDGTETTTPVGSDATLIAKTKAALQALVAQAQTLSEGKYTEETKAALASAEQAAEQLLSQSDATYVELAAAQSDLQDAIEKLVPLTTPEQTVPTKPATDPATSGKSTQTPSTPKSDGKATSQPVQKAVPSTKPAQPVVKATVQAPTKAAAVQAPAQSATKSLATTKSNQTALPQTDEQSQNGAVAAGLAVLTGLFGFLGFHFKKKRSH